MISFRVNSDFMSIKMCTACYIVFTETVGEG